jgi:hypothetical protein
MVTYPAGILQLCPPHGQYEYFSVEIESNYLAHVVCLVAFQLIVVVAFHTLQITTRASQYEYSSLEVKSNYLAHVFLLHFRLRWVRRCAVSCQKDSSGRCRRRRRSATF